jgi:hypothetical protein
MTRVLGTLVFTAAMSILVFAQASFNTTLHTTDFSGEWTEIPHEIGFTAELYDYSGGLIARIFPPKAGTYARIGCGFQHARASSLAPSIESSGADA